MSNVYAVLSLVGFVSAIAGIALLWGAGWALLVGGCVLFAVGGMGSAREGQ